MKSFTLRESPLPVVLALTSLFGFVEYLHWKVVQREDRAQVVHVPAHPPGTADDPSEDSSTLFEVATPSATGEARPSGPLHVRSKELSAGGQTLEALKSLDASLASEGRRDPQRLLERGVLLLRLGRSREALTHLEEAEQLGGGSDVLHYHLALAHSRVGDPSGAEVEYRKTLEMNPRFDEAWNNLGLLLAARGDRPGALEALNRAVELAPVSSRQRPLVNLARLLSRTGRAEEARARLEEAIRLAPSDLSPRMALAILESEVPARRERARELGREILRLAPSDPAGHFVLGLVESRSGDRAAAEKEYWKALELQAGYHRARFNLAQLLLDDSRPAEAAGQFEILVRVSSDSRAAFGLARARRAQNDLEGAEAAYREAIRLTSGRYPEAFLNLGSLLHDSGRDSESEAAYRKALEQDPGYAAAWLNLALLMSDLGRLPEALEASSSAVAAEGASEKAWFVRGRLLSDAKRPEEALSAYREALKRKPGYTKAMINAALLLAGASQNDEAIGLYRDVLRTDPRNAVAWYNLGVALGRAGRTEEAREAYEKSLHADPEATSAAQNLGVLYARAGRIEDARRVFAEALERAPEDVGVRYNLALQLEKLKQTDEALREMARVVKLNPAHARAWRVLGRLLEAKGRKEEAARARQRAAELDPRKSPKK